VETPVIVIAVLLIGIGVFAFFAMLLRLVCRRGKLRLKGVPQ
jgi:hypothetical protein